jgi:hypothetical protein
MKVLSSSHFQPAGTPSRARSAGVNAQMPPTFIASIYGMNFKEMPELE